MPRLREELESKVKAELRDVLQDQVNDEDCGSV